MCSNYFSVAVINTVTKIKGKDYVCLHCQLKVHHWEQRRTLSQELKQRSLWTLLTGLLWLTCSACFLICPEATCPNWYYPWWARPSPHQSANKEMLTDRDRPFWGKQFFLWSPCFSVDSVRLIKRKHRTHLFNVFTDVFEKCIDFLSGY